MSHKVDDAATATAMQDHREHKPSHAALDAHDGHEPSGHGNRGRHGAGTGKHAGHHVEMFRLRFWWSLLLAVPVILTGHMRPLAKSALPQHPASAEDSRSTAPRNPTSARWSHPTKPVHEHWIQRRDAPPSPRRALPPCPSRPNDLREYPRGA